jgi:hypothetical protein
MIRKSALYALAVAVLMGAVAASALADDKEMRTYGPEESVTTQPEQGMEQPNTGEIREPTETGTIPEQPESPPEPLRQNIDELPSLNIGELK